MMHSILDTTSADTFRVFLSGSNNFRHEIYPEYKANRKDMVDPKWRKLCKEYLVTEWDAEVTDGYEADDALGINQDTKGTWEQGEHSPMYNTIICTIDKDLDMIPGMHYSWPIVRGGAIVREGKIYEVSKIEGIRSFYRSMLVGDRTDNIFGVDGIGKVKAAKEINHLETEEEMFDRVAELYQGDMDRMLVNGKCLFIMREEGKQWEFPTSNN
jgi:DNA polymerase-1